MKKCKDTTRGKECKRDERQNEASRGNCNNAKSNKSLVVLADTREEG